MLWSVDKNTVDEGKPVHISSDHGASIQVQRSSDGARLLDMQ